MLDLDAAELLRFRPAFVIDATELGDLLPLAGVDYRVGAESVAETGEPHAQPLEPKPHCVQSFTYTFALERAPAARGPSRPERPEKYEHYRDAQPYSLTIEVHGGEIYGEESGWLTYRLFEQMPGTKGPLWTYRRLDRRGDAPPRLPHATSRCSTGRETTTATRASWTLPPIAGRSRAAGRQACEPRLPPLAADRGARRGRPARARPSSGCGPT